MTNNDCNALRPVTAEQQAALLKYAKVAKAQLAIGRIPSEGPQ